MHSKDSCIEGRKEVECKHDLIASVINVMRGAGMPIWCGLHDCPRNRG